MSLEETSAGKDKVLVILLEHSDLYNGDFPAAYWENNIHCIPFLAYGDNICNTFQRMIFSLPTEEFDVDFSDLKTIRVETTR